MSDPDNFLSRWSRRKLEPQKEREDTVAPPTTPDEAQPGVVESEAAAAPEQPQEPPFDPATLPPIESITAGTDIRDFLRPGVPLSLSRAALRRAWSSDPAIRDFIEIAENQWDFTNDSIAGFGPLDPAEVPRLLAKIISSTKDTASAILEDPSERPQSAPPENAVAKGENSASVDREGDGADRQNVSADLANASTTETVEQPEPNNTAERAASQRNKENGAAQNGEADTNLSYAPARHGHGGALPT